MKKRGRPQKTFRDKLERCDLSMLTPTPEDVAETPSVEELACFYESILTEDWIGKASEVALFFVASSLRDNEEVRKRTERLLELCADSDTFDSYCTAEELSRALDRFLEDWPVSFFAWSLKEYSLNGLVDKLAWKPESLAEIARARLKRGEGNSALLEKVASALEAFQGVLDRQAEEEAEPPAKGHCLGKDGRTGFYALHV
jgi:hypothetical protein